eukprot:Opistho-1_new@91190
MTNTHNARAVTHQHSSHPARTRTHTRTCMTAHAWLKPIARTEMWVNIFMWTVLSTALVHVLAGTVAFFSFRKVPFAWAIPLVYLAFGILIASALSSITGGSASVCVCVCVSVGLHTTSSVSATRSWAELIVSRL